MNLTAVWGSPGAGKTAISLALGAAWAQAKQDTLILSTDSDTPSLPLFLPRNTELQSKHSIGGLLEEAITQEDRLKDRIHRHPKSEHLFFMGHVSGEQAGISYRPPQRATIAALLQVLQQSPFQHIIADCRPNPAYDALTLLALERADAVVRVVTPDVKGFEWQKSQMAWLGNSDAFDVGRHIKVGSPFHPFSPKREAAALFGGFDHEMPFARQVMERMLAGELLRGFDELPGIEFERHIQAIAKEVAHG